MCDVIIVIMHIILAIELCSVAVRFWQRRTARNWIQFECAAGWCGLGSKSGSNNKNGLHRNLWLSTLKKYDVQLAAQTNQPQRKKEKKSQRTFSFCCIDLIGQR